MTTLFTYPMDLIHTRMATDMSPKTGRRKYMTAFECFNQTNIDEGRGGLYKGWGLNASTAFLRGWISLPIIDFVR